MPQPDTQLQPPGRAGLVGTGAFGRFCVSAYQETGDIRVPIGADPDETARFELQHLGVRAVSDWREVVNHPEVEVVQVATPPFARGEIVQAALQAGKSVFVEKPLALTLTEADRMIQTAEASGATIGIDYVMRHLSAYRLLRALKESGIMGEIRTISLENFAQAVPEGHWFWDPGRSGGILVEHGVHFFDAYAQVAGEARSVVGRRPRSVAIEVTVLYESGAIGRYYHEFAFPLEVERASGVAFFTRGHVVIEGWIPTAVKGMVLAGAKEVQAVADDLGLSLDIEGENPTRFSIAFPDRQANYRHAVVAGMRDVLHRHRDPSWPMTVAVGDARSSLAVAIAGEEAATSGMQVSL